MAVYASIGLLQFAKVQPGFAIRLLKASIHLLIAFSRLPGLHATFPDQILPFQAIIKVQLSIINECFVRPSRHHERSVTIPGR